MVVGCRNLVKDPAARREDAAIARPSQPESQVDIFIIRSEQRIEPAGAAEGLDPVERAAATGPEYLIDRPIRPSRDAAVRGRAWTASPSRRRNRRPESTRFGSDRTSTSGATEPTVSSANGARPAWTQPPVTSVSLLRSWMYCPRAAAIPAFAAAQKPPLRSSVTTRTPGYARASHSAVPSVEPSSATTTSIGHSPSGGRCRSTLARQLRNNSRPL